MFTTRRMLGALAVCFTLVARVEGQTSVDAGTTLAALLYGPSGQGIANDLSVQAFLDTLVNGATSFPIAASSGAFTFKYDLGRGPAPDSNSFGPMFAERPLTNGRHVLNIALAYQYTRFDSIAGQPLKSLQAITPNRRYNDFFGTISYESSLEITTDRKIVSASYGLTRRVDVGIIVPFGRTTVSGSSVLEGIDAGGVVRTLVKREARQGSSSGIADVVVRTKVALPSVSGLKLAAVADFRAPTNGPEKLLGVGVKQAKGMIAGSGGSENASAHFNFAYTKSGRDDSQRVFDLPIHVFDEVSYTAGVDFAATQKLTVVADVIGRTFVHAGTIDFVVDGGRTEFVRKKGELNVLLGTVGAKMLIGKRVVVAGSVVVPLNEGGLRPKVTPVIGFESTFRLGQEAKNSGRP